MADNVAALVIQWVSVTAYHVAALEFYHAYTGASVIRRVAMMAAPVAARTGYHS